MLLWCTENQHYWCIHLCSSNTTTKRIYFQRIYSITCPCASQRERLDDIITCCVSRMPNVVMQSQMDLSLPCWVTWILLKKKTHQTNTWRLGLLYKYSTWITSLWRTSGCIVTFHSCGLWSLVGYRNDYYYVKRNGARVCRYCAFVCFILRGGGAFVKTVIIPDWLGNWRLEGRDGFVSSLIVLKSSLILRSIYSSLV